MAAELDDQVRPNCVYCLEKVPNMYALDRASRALQKLVTFARKRNNGPVAAFSHASGNQPYYTLMPFAVVNAYALGPALRPQRIDIGKRLFTHRGLDVTALAVNAIKLACVVHRHVEVIGQQAFDANRNIFQSPRLIDPRADGEAKIGADAPRRLPPRKLKQRFDSCDGFSRANTQQTLLHQYSVVVIKWHNIGNRPQGNEIEVLCGYLCSAFHTLFLQHAPDTRHQVERNADAGQITAWKLAAFEVRIDYHRCIREFITR